MALGYSNCDCQNVLIVLYSMLKSAWLPLMMNVSFQKYSPLLGLAQMLATSDGQQAHFIVKLHLKMNPGAELHIFQRGENYWTHFCCYFLLQSFVGSYEAKLTTGSSLFPYLFQLLEEQYYSHPTTSVF